MSEKQNIFTEITPEEAIIELNRCKVSGYMPTDWHRRGLAVRAATEAVRKHIPQKVEKHERFKADRRCPVCKYLAIGHAEYCHHCGQALEWDE